MAKICPITNEKVIYLTCQECEDRYECSKKAPAGKNSSPADAGQEENESIKA